MPTKKKETTPRKKKPTKKKTPAKTKRTEKVPSLLLKKERGFYIVGMGASAGGLEAFEKFFKHMPQDPGLAFVLVPHLDPTHVSLMPELIQKSSTMAVTTVKDGFRVLPNTVYVVPPNKDLAILNGTLQLIDPLEARGRRLPIDYFLRSLAQDQREKAICIILSGTGTDGTLGLKAIKGELGMAIVQDPESAGYDGMPVSAIKTGLADYVLPPEQMPQELMRFTKHAVRRVNRVAVSTEAKIPDALPKIFVLLRARTGHDFSLYKQNTLCRRIERRMNIHHIERVSNYVRFLQENQLEVETLFKELLIGVTNFFRDPEAFEALKKALLQQLASRADDYALRVWVPGCANGEEAYSIAIILRECMAELKRTFDVQVFATDIDREAVEAARLGSYPESIAADVTSDRLKRFFIREENVYRIKKEVRELLIFAPQSIIKDPPFTKLDLVCCRNVLIYLDSALQKKLLPLFHYVLKPQGILFLGTSETIGGFTDLFSVADKKWKIYKRKESVHATQAIIEFPTILRVAEADEIPDMEKLSKPGDFNISQFVEKTLLEQYSPSCVIINPKGEILYLHGQTGKYLAPAPGKPRWNIMDMAREGLKLQLSSAIRKALFQKGRVTYEGVQVKNNGGINVVNVTVEPMSKPERMRGSLMVLFEDMAPLPQERADKAKSGPKKKTKQLEALEQELQYTKEHLQSTIEELETSNEELKSTNEELQSTNEELQSTNEELETSKEELQSLNEELITVNHELEGKLDELTKSHNDMRNLMNSTDIATMFLDTDLCIKRFTPQMARVVNVIASDMGRPLSHIRPNLNYENLVEDAQGVIETLAIKEAEVQTGDAHWYKMRILPYRTIDNVIEGAVITFVDIHEQKIAAEKIRNLMEYADNIVDTVREPLLVLDAKLHVVSANRSFYQSFQVDPEETTGSLLYDLGDGQWDIPKLRELLEHIIPENTVFNDFEVDHEFPGIGRKKMLLNARRLMQKGEETSLILLAMEEVSDRGAEPGKKRKRAKQ